MPKQWKWTIWRFWERLKMVYSYWAVLKHDHDMDHTEIYNILEHKIKRMIDSFEKNPYKHDSHERTIKQMRYALYLIDLVCDCTKRSKLAKLEADFEEKYG